MPIKQYLSPHDNDHAGHVPAKIWTADIEDAALEQVRKLTHLPFIHKHVAIMPDVHAGIGSTVGAVIPTRGAIIPAAVGVDIGCGMIAAKLDFTADQLPDNLSELRANIERRVPVGRTDNGGKNDRGAWGILPPDIVDQWMDMERSYLRILEQHPKIEPKSHPARHLGTLGTGNHFIEICVDEDDGVWIMLHSGSRGIGNKIGQYFIGLAKDDMKTWFINIPDVDLAYLPEGTKHFDDYIYAMTWAQEFAAYNRRLMLLATWQAVEETLNRTVALLGQPAINCHHNYATKEHHYGANIWVTRKGAVRARDGDLGIIPGSMGTGSFIVRGKGNPESFHSCSHGAGRRMSRTAARAKFTAADLAAQTEGIECRKDDGIVDEIPAAYKDIGEVMENQSDLVEVVYRLRQVVNVKG